MRVADLSEDTIEKIRRCRYDRIIEKHEGPEQWDWLFRYGDPPELLEIDGYFVLLPLGRDHHPKLTILRLIVSEEQQVLTIFLKDAWYAEAYNVDPETDTSISGFLAVCEKFPGQNFYLATVYHEWLIVDNPELSNKQ